MENHQQNHQHRKRIRKKKNQKKKACFIYFLLAYILVISPFIYTSIRGEEYHNVYIDKAKAVVTSFWNKEETVIAVEESTEITTVALQEETTVTETQSGLSQEIIAEENTTQAQSTEEESTASDTASKEFVQVDESYFDDALFIGDSRTVGIKEYSFIKNADFFADNSMTSFAIMEKELEVGSVGKTTLPNLLATKTYKKIYVMLGINELGYPYNSVIKKYGEVLKTVREYQPQAIIFVEANLHVTKSRSDKDELYNNTNINKLNAGMKELSDNMENSYYIDINEVFDDEWGSLRADYAGDSAHVYGKYYNDWAKWLCTKGIL